MPQGPGALQAGGGGAQARTPSRSSSRSNTSHAAGLQSLHPKSIWALTPSLKLFSCEHYQCSIFSKKIFACVKLFVICDSVIFHICTNRIRLTFNHTAKLHGIAHIFVLFPFFILHIDCVFVSICFLHESLF